jgi:hypothetical protein
VTVTDVIERRSDASVARVAVEAVWIWSRLIPGDEGRDRHQREGDSQEESAPHAIDCAPWRPLTADTTRGASETQAHR